MEVKLSFKDKLKENFINVKSVDFSHIEVYPSVTPLEEYYCGIATITFKDGEKQSIFCDSIYIESGD